MVTKQQHLEWLAKHFDFDIQTINYVIMSSAKAGLIIGSGTSEAPESSSLSTRRHIITREEWQQERDKMQKQGEKADSWHERGELPPVGCECEIMHRCWIEPNKVKIAAITKEYVIVVDGQREQHYYLRDITFRPLRTEREKAIDEMISVTLAVINQDTQRQMFGMLYDAGYRKEQSK